MEDKERRVALILRDLHKNLDKMEFLSSMLHRAAKGDPGWNEITTEEYKGARFLMDEVQQALRNQVNQLEQACGIEKAKDKTEEEGGYLFRSHISLLTRPETDEEG